MATYNFVDSAAKGYTSAWEHHKTLLPMCILPFVVKVVCYVLIAAFGLTEAYLRQGWVLLPTYFVEGWVAACLIRLVMFDEPWPTRGKLAQDEAYLLRRAKFVMAGTVTYVLIKLVFSLLAGFLMDSAGSLEQIEEAPAPTFETFVIGSLVLAAIVWSFRLLWLFIPVTMEVPIRVFLRKAGGFITSVYMIGTWLLCLMPMALIFMFLIQGLYFLVPGSDDTPSIVFQFLFVMLQSAVELVIIAVTTIAMTDGIQSLLTGRDEVEEDDDSDFF